MGEIVEDADRFVPSREYMVPQAVHETKGFREMDEIMEHAAVLAPSKEKWRNGHWIRQRCFREIGGIKLWPFLFPCGKRDSGLAPLKI